MVEPAGRVACYDCTERMDGTRMGKNAPILAKICVIDIWPFGLLANLAWS